MPDVSSDPSPDVAAAWRQLTGGFDGVVVVDDVRAACPQLDPREHRDDDAPGGALRRGIVEVAAGRPAAGLPHLIRAMQGEDPDRRARARAWARLATHLDAEAVPGGSVTSATEVLAHRMQLTPLPPIDELTVPAAVALECTVVGELLPRIRLARTFLEPMAGGAELLPLVEEAITFVQGVEGDAQAAGDRTLVAFCQRARADLLHRSGREADAAMLLQEARSRAAERGDAIEVGACRLLEGDLIAAPVTHPDAADTLLHDSGTETSELPFVLEEPATDGAEPDHAAAEAAYEQAHTAFAAAGHVRGLATVALRRATLRGAAGDHAAAVVLADDAAEQARVSGDEVLGHTAAVHGLLARIGAGHPTLVLDVPEQVAGWGAGPGSFSYAWGLGLLLNRVGRRWLTRHADAERAVTCHALARRLFAALGAGTQADQALADAAVVHGALGASLEAATEFDQALEGHRGRLDDPIRQGDAWRRSGGLALRLHNLAVAGTDPDAIRRSADRLQSIRDAAPPDAAEGMDAHLLQLLDSSLAGAETNALLAESDAARAAGDEDARRSRCEAALAAAGDDLLLRAACLARLRRFDEATAAYRDHQAELEREQEAIRHTLIKMMGPKAVPGGTLPGGVTLPPQYQAMREALFLVRIGAFEAAAAAFDQLDLLAPDWRPDDQPWQLVSDHGRARHELAQYERAAELHQEAIEALEERTLTVRRDEVKTTLNTGSARIFGRAACTSLASRPTDAEARARSLTLADRGRARALADLLAMTRSTAAADDEALRSWSAASATVTLWYQTIASAAASPTADPDNVAVLRERLAEAQRELDARTAELRGSNAGFARSVAPQEPTTAEELAATLGPRTGLVSHLLVDDQLLVHGVTSEGLAVATVVDVDARRLEGLLRAFTQGCSSGGAWLDTARELTALLLEPVRDVLDDAERLYLVPTGLGSLAPLHALPWGEGLLGEQAAVATLPSAVTLRHLSAPDLGPGAPALVVGDPESMVLSSPSGDLHEPLEALPFARLEAAAVARSFANSRLLLGGDATVDNVRADLDGVRLLHLATHAHVDQSVPLATSLLLARGGALRLVDLIGARLDAELVVLSACDTGRGVVTGGDEVLSMTRALLAAGASSAIVSLWPVDDASTSLLMARFAGALAAGSEPSRALQQAQQWLRGLDADAMHQELGTLREDAPVVDGRLRTISRRDRPRDVPPAHPFHWAAFTYVGAHPGDLDRG